MDPIVAHKLRTALIQLGVGLVLVGLAGWYLSNHPAEWQSIKSSASTVRHKVGDWFGSLRNGESVGLITTKQEQAIASLEEIIDSIKKCDSRASVNEYETLLTNIKNSSLEDFVRNSPEYYSQMSVAYQNMQELCIATSSG